MKNSILYNSLNELSLNRMPEICKRIERFVSDKGYSDVIEKINCSLEKHLFGQDTQWRIDAEVDDYPYDETGHPFGIGGFIFLEDVAERKTVFFKTQMYNSFDKTIEQQHEVEIDYDKANDMEFVETLMRQTSIFLDQFYDRFTGGAEVFIQEWRKLEIYYEQ
jgi:hypothetical protein